MKKQFLFGMAAVAALCSCSNNEVLEAPESLKTPIAFGTYVGNSVDGRAADGDLAGMKTGTNTDGCTINKGFGVFAYYTAQNTWTTSDKPNFMYNENIQWNGSAWRYTPLKYWPNNSRDKVSFFAYAPYDAGSTSNFTFTESATMTEPKFTFTVNPTVKQQQDLLIAKIVNQIKQTNVDNAAISIINDKVTFNFEHALARIGFKVQAIVDNVNSPATGTEARTPNAGILDAKTTISVQKVELIGNFYATGTVDLAMAGEADDVSHKRFSPVTKLSEGTNYVINGAGVENVSGYGFTLTYNATDNESNFVPSTTNESGTVPSTSQTVGTTLGQLNANDSYIMVIPQAFTEDDKLQIRVTYKVTTEDSKLNGGISEITNTITSSAFNYTFERGKAYWFNLYLGMTSANFDASIIDWATGENISVNVPLNKN